MNEQFTYTALATLLNAVEEVEQNFAAGDLDADQVAHLVRCAAAPEIRALARELRTAAAQAAGNEI